MILAKAGGPIGPILFVAVILALIGVAMAITAVVERKRRRLMQENAVRLGLTYAEKDTIRLLESLPAVKAFQTGHSRRASNILFDPKDPDRSLLLFDYRYTTGSGKNSSTTTWTVCVLRLAAPLPIGEIAIQQQSFFVRLASRFGTKLIDLSDDPEFSRVCAIASDDDPAVVRKVLSPELRRTLASADTKLIAGIVLAREAVIVYANRFQAGTIEKMDELMAYAVKVQGCMPALEAGEA